jgi:copper homeostasis protein
MGATFHRAFDETANLEEALEAVIATGADCLLTSGGEPSVAEGAERIAALQTQANGRIEIMAGGGLTLANLPEIARITRANWLHGSLIRRSGRASSGLPSQAGQAAGLAGIHPSGEALEQDVRAAVALLNSHAALGNF